MMETSWITANIGRGVSVNTAMANMARVRQSAPFPLVGWQEIDEADLPDEHRMLGKVFGNGYRNVGFDRKEPISVPLNQFKVGHVEVTKIMDGVPVKNKGPASPDRFVVAAEVMPERCSNFIWAVNFHLANFATSDPRWRESLSKAQTLIHKYVHYGNTVVYTCDSNANHASDMPPMHPNEHRVVADGNDYMGIIPGSVEVSVRRKFVINLTIDGHNGHGVMMSFKDAKHAPRKPVSTVWPPVMEVKSGE
jgi:hypothetical protein